MKMIIIKRKKKRLGYIDWGLNDFDVYGGIGRIMLHP